MKKTVTLIIAVLALFAAPRALAQDNDASFAVFVPITRYLSQGDVNSLSSWFADNIDITVISSSRNCSRSQAVQILRTFFNSYTPRSFEESHRASEGNKKYLVGFLNAGGELFQVTIYATAAEGETYKIQQLGITRMTAVY